MIKKYNDFILEFKETESNTPVLYKDDNVEVKVVKTFKACAEQGKNTLWCSNSKEGFYGHNKTANMYRFNFKDGYKLRLTWDYITQNASELGDFSGGTHWGQGGIVKNTMQWYNVIRPEDDSEPFLFDYTKKDDRAKMVKRIESIPQKAQDAVHKYQNEKSIEKSANLNTMYKEIQKISIKSVKLDDDIDDDDDDIYIITISYLGNDYIIKIIQYKPSTWGSKQNIYFGDFIKVFRNNMALTNKKELKSYIKDKFIEWIKKNKQEIYVKWSERSKQQSLVSNDDEE